MKAILFDVDGVLLDWHGGFVAYMERRHGIKSAVGADEFADYGGFSDLFPGLDLEERARYIAAFNTSPDFAGLRGIEGAARGMQRIAAVLDGRGIQIIGVTCAGPDAAVERRRQMARFPFNDIRILSIGASKAPIFRRYAPAVVIEDAPAHLDEAKAAGCVPIAVSYPYNASWRGMRASWKTLPDLVLDCVFQRRVA